MRIRISFLVAVLLLPLAAYAGGNVNRDMLLASDGTLYTVDSVAPDTLKDVATSAAHVLTLTIQKGKKSTTVPVPASLTDGYHFTPALAYDADSKTVFIFWEIMRDGGFASDLAFSSYHDGTWGTAATLDSIAWDLRQNLRIAITRSTETKDEDGNVKSIPEVTVHAVWWEVSGSSEWARYAMLTIGNGNVVATHVQDLTDFTAAKGVAAVNGTDEQEFLRHPGVFESPNHATVDIVFGDMASDTLHRITMKPVAVEGRLRIPIGRNEHPLPTVHAQSTHTSGDASAISTASDNLAFYSSTADAMEYYVLKNGKWASQSVALGGVVTRDAAVDALRRMLASE
jgi:hypothetical protein